MEEASDRLNRAISDDLSKHRGVERVKELIRRDVKGAEEGNHVSTDKALRCKSTFPRYSLS